MNYEMAVICSFLFLGMCFGFVTFTHRHLFSEGPDKAQDADPDSLLKSRFMWVMVCTWLWPIMVFTGINTAWILSKRRKKTQKSPDPY